MSDPHQLEMAGLKKNLLLMASHAEAAVNHAVRALLRRDDELARRTGAEDSIIDRLEMEIDDAAVRLLACGLSLPEVRQVAAAMKIAHNLERVGDEATTISRRCLALSLDPPLPQATAVPPMAQLVLRMLKQSLDAFVHRDPARARAIVPQDVEVDDLHRRHRKELAACMAAHPALVERCLDLMVVVKSLERIADHAKNIAEAVVYLNEGTDIRHAAARARAPASAACDPPAAGLKTNNTAYEEENPRRR